MGRRNLGHLARDRLRQSREYNQPKVFIPSLSVERPVLMDDKESGEYRRNVYKQLGKRISDKHRRFRVLRLNEMRMKVVDQHAFVNRLQESGTKPSADDMIGLAEILKGRLLRLLEDSPTHQSLVLGEVARFKEPDIKRPNRIQQSIGVSPTGWHGDSAAYASRDENGQLTPLGTIIELRRLCMLTITENDDQLNTKGILPPPHVPLLGNVAQIREEDFRSIQTGMNEALPNEFVIGDPVIYVRTERQAKVLALPVRSVKPFEQSENVA